MTRAEAVRGARVVVVDAARATCHLPSDARRWGQVLRGLHRRTGVVLDRRRSTRRAPGEPTYLYARVRLDLRERERDEIVVAVPLAGLELLPRDREADGVVIDLPRWP